MAVSIGSTEGRRSLLAFDPTQPHSGNRSLSIVFNSAAVNDAGILQIIPVQPNTNYEFSANFKAEDIEGAGRTAICDPGLLYGNRVLHEPRPEGR